MSGTLQLLAHFGLAGISLGLGIAAFHDVSVVRLIFAALFWCVAYFHFADALWIPSWGAGRDAIDRIGIAIKGAGFAMIAISAVLVVSIASILIGVAGLLVIVFGRILWELTIVGRTSTNDGG